MTQTWNDLLFAHWPISADLIRPLVPQVLPLDTFDGSCWIAVAPFHMSGIRARGLPPIPGHSEFPELNVRTYVVLDDKPGVFFFSLDVTKSLAVWAARTFYHLPYFRAQMSVSHENGGIEYASTRLVGNATFRASYHPIAPVQLRAKGTLEHWLTERYCLYSVANGRVYRGDIHHHPWPLQNAAAQMECFTMFSAAGIVVPKVAPLLHFSSKIEVLLWPLQRVC
ncbi:MAG TPA: DUF2071 domain-containing protein [Terriglobales bacterium]|jgi:hypothetical protein